MPETCLTLTPEAQTALSAMASRVGSVSAAYGRNSDEYLDMLESLCTSLLSVLRLGGRISRDDELSLYGVSFIHYGVVFHPKRIDGHHDPVLGEWGVHS